MTDLQWTCYGYWSGLPYIRWVSGPDVDLGPSRQPGPSRGAMFNPPSQNLMVRVTFMRMGLPHPFGVFECALSEGAGLHAALL